MRSTLEEARSMEGLGAWFILQAWRDRQAADFRPILIVYISVDDRCNVRGVETVLTVLARARDPIVFARLDFEVVGLEAAALQALKDLPA